MGVFDFFKERGLNWWFSYGIRDVGATLHDLENKGFITLGTAKDAVKNLTIS